MSFLETITAMRISEAYADPATAARAGWRGWLPRLRNSGMVSQNHHTPEDSTRRRPVSYAEEQMNYYAQPHQSGPESIINFRTNQWDQVDRKWITGMLNEIQKTPAQKAEDAVRALDIKEGDRVRLTYKKAPDASQIEGKVIGVKDKNGQIQLRIEGFGKTGGGGAGGQYVWFVAADYTVEVLHRAYRWTTDDELTVQIAGRPRGDWEKYTEAQRNGVRSVYAARVERIKQILQTDLLTPEERAEL
jgi:hypothetical protein